MSMIHGLDCGRQRETSQGGRGRVSHLEVPIEMNKSKSIARQQKDLNILSRLRIYQNVSCIINSFIKMNQEDFHNMTLAQMLQLQLQSGSGKDLYVHALVKSRKESLFQDTAHLLFELYNKDGDRWLEVVRRLLENNFEEGFQLLRQSYHFLRCIITEVYNRGTESHKRETNQLVKQTVQSSITNRKTIGPMQKSIINQTLSFHIDLAMKRKEIALLQDILLFLTQESSAHLSTFLSLHFNPAMDPIEWKWHKNSILLLTSLTWMLRLLSAHSVRSMAVEKFSSSIQELKKNMIQENMPHLLTLFSLMRNSEGRPFQLFSGSLNLESKYKFQVSDHFTNIVLIFTNICSTAQLEDTLAFNRQAICALVRGVIYDIDLLNLASNSNESEELIAINYEIASGNFSDTLQGRVVGFMHFACIMIGTFYQQYIMELYEFYVDQILGKPKLNNALLNFLLKLAVFSHNEILPLRKDELLPFLKDVTQHLSSLWPSLQRMEKIQVLRFFISFTEEYDSGYTSMVNKCFDLCITSLQDEPQSEVSEQCYDILMELPSHKGAKSIILSDLIFVVFSQLYKLDLKTEKTMTLFLRYVEAFPVIIGRSSEQIIEPITAIFRWERDRLRSNQLKTSQLIIIILDGIISILSTGYELSFQILEDCLVPMLDELNNPYSIEYEEKLIEIMNELLVSHRHLTPGVCMVMGGLGEVYEKNEKKMSILSPILKGLCEHKQILKQIEYQYFNLIEIFLQIFSKYLEESFSPNQYVFYSDEITHLFNSLQKIIRDCNSSIQDNEIVLETLSTHIFPSFKNMLLQDCSEANLTERIVQFIMTISHTCLCPNSGNVGKNVIRETCQILKAIDIGKYESLHTVRMIPIIFADFMYACPEEQEKAFQDILAFYSTKRLMKMSGNVKWVSNEDGWQEWPLKPKTYIENVLRELRNNKCLEQIEHMEYLKYLNQHYI